MDLPGNYREHVFTMIRAKTVTVNVYSAAIVLSCEDLHGPEGPILGSRLRNSYEFALGNSSCWYQQPKPPDAAGEKISEDSHFGHLKRDVACVGNNLCAAHPPTVRS